MIVYSPITCLNCLVGVDDGLVVDSEIDGNVRDDDDGDDDDKDDVGDGVGDDDDVVVGTEGHDVGDVVNSSSTMIIVGVDVVVDDDTDAVEIT